MGATGRAVGAHLHYEIKVNKKPVDPYKFISIGRELLSSSILKINQYGINFAHLS